MRPLSKSVLEKKRDMGYEKKRKNTMLSAWLKNA
jgi:hypothetical protein